MRHSSYIKLDEKEELELYKFIEESNKAREKKRAMGVLLNSQKISVLEISKKLSSCTDAVYNWLIRYKRGGVASLKDIPQQGRPKILKVEDEDKIKEVFKK
ncbi:helix-turn-helix domain-containing protein [Sulfurimonas sediminis]|uniref:Helix-turn-helix domain-containing protein n=1 Tax=Sulfurimonas sediminis TaxID=2590020 RepID=A0A7M1AYY0_9BACT|nr:helix-turn-helix domain-containing protein [Sulfurimonas sediminis]QOP42651.1 helix-turn-helix domain-containing protein [Sulfurimonas sediminis]QOP43274.1 helix-turn-helix domain-containing protein [Sulfurimonas sediminis]QOP43436.1 helix-turn-helix domain-containing protein [Sulfurimonas sediminis]